MRKRSEPNSTRPVAFIPLAAAIDSALSAPKIRQQILASVLASEWEEIVGTTIFNHVKPTALSGSVLTLQADSSVWRQQVSFLKNDLKDRINSKLGYIKIRDIKVR
ncbi:MAG: DUF721 domain-containing protein [bacterium]|nr:DUF721 domain-containing protein [bacterium]